MRDVLCFAEDLPSRAINPSLFLFPPFQFAAVQFSEDAKLEFDFNDYTSNPNPEKLLANVVHAEQITNTFKAIKFVA